MIRNTYYGLTLVPVYDQRIRKIYPRELNKRFGSKFRVGSKVRHETPEESRRMHRSKCCEYNNKDEDNSSNTLNNKNYTGQQQICCLRFLADLGGI